MTVRFPRASIDRLRRLAKDRPLLALLAVLAVVSAVFLLFPSLDIAVSRAFYDGSRFPLIVDPTLRAVRDFGTWVTTTVVVLAILGVVVPLTRGWRRFVFAPHEGIYVLLVYLVGPGLIVNSLFKNVFGRARPREIVEFGGAEAFSRVWVVSDSCLSNCSFVSGEGAAAAALLCVLVAVPRSERLVVGAGLTVVAGVVSLNRVAFGGHFISDTLIAWLIVLLVAVALKPVFFGRRGEAIDAAVARMSARVAPARKRLEAPFLRAASGLWARLAKRAR